MRYGRLVEPAKAGEGLTELDVRDDGVFDGEVYSIRAVVHGYWEALPVAFDDSVVDSFGVEEVGCLPFAHSDDECGVDGGIEVLPSHGIRGDVLFGSPVDGDFGKRFLFGAACGHQANEEG